MRSSSLSVLILTRNESKHIARAIKSVKSFASRILVVDSFSTDNTIEIAKQEGAFVLQHSFENYAKQFDWALAHDDSGTDWVMRLDADEVVSSDLAVEIATTLQFLSLDVVGINIPRRHVFMGRWIRYGGRYPLVLLRIWRRGNGQIESRWMDEHIKVQGGISVSFRGYFSDINLNNLTWFTDKHNQYATREAIDFLLQKYNLAEIDTFLPFGKTGWQAYYKRILKESLYNRLPLWFGPAAYFLFRYLGQFGFLEGIEGTIYHFLQGFWYRFLVAAKIEEYDRKLRALSSSEDRILELSRLTGHILP